VDQADGLAARPVGLSPVGAADQPTLLGPAGRVRSRGLVPVVLGHRERFVLEGRVVGPREICLVRVWAGSRCRIWDGAVLQGEVAGS
jgi:hypothetical protein